MDRNVRLFYLIMYITLVGIFAAAISNADAQSNRTQYFETWSTKKTNQNLVLAPTGTGSVVVSTDLDVDNININSNTIGSTNANGNIILEPNGSGYVDAQGGLKIDTSAVTITTILDEDNMASNSATALATQQSIKAYVDSAAGGSTSKCIVEDVKSSSAAGGGGSGGAWLARVLNTTSGSCSFLTLAGGTTGTGGTADIMQLTAGDYYLECSAPAYLVDAHKIRLWNDSDSTALKYGTAEFNNNSGSDGQTRSFVRHSFTLASTKNIKIEHYVVTTTSGNDFGRPVGSEVEIYTSCVVEKL